ncbi:MAG: hypothetical protein ACR2MC_11645 [Actinomycetota bacterium]
MSQERPLWESELVDEAVRAAEKRYEAERERASRRALQLAREQGYHRLAVALDRPQNSAQIPGQLCLFVREGTLFDDAG